MGVAYDERFLHELRSAIVLRGPHKIAVLPEKPVNYSSSWPKVARRAGPKPDAQHCCCQNCMKI